MRALETERLILRKWKMSDLEDLYEYAKNPNVGPNAGWKPHESKEESKTILDLLINNDDIWAITYKSNHKVIGSISLYNDPKREYKNVKMIGYAISENYWGQGLVPEAVMEVLRYTFEELGLNLISIYHYPFNYRSRRVIEKCGFHYEGIIRMGSHIYNGLIYDDVCYSMTDDEWFRGIRYN
ncbi:MAG: hypothetical protein K0S41_3979 [Anaerocolumna sp.]|jgi:putative acetyltransferase|nr:hypothetical protein [Anaerocolumna sp.]